MGKRIPAELAYLVIALACFLLVKAACPAEQGFNALVDTSTGAVISAGYCTFTPGEGQVVIRNVAAEIPARFTDEYKYTTGKIVKKTADELAADKKAVEDEAAIQAEIAAQARTAAVESLKTKGTLKADFVDTIGETAAAKTKTK